MECILNKEIVLSDEQKKCVEDATKKFYEGKPEYTIAAPAGSGKTTLLRIIAGLETANGTIKIEDDIWLDDKYSPMKF